MKINEAFERECEEKRTGSKWKRERRKTIQCWEDCFPLLTWVHEEAEEHVQYTEEGWDYHVVVIYSVFLLLGDYSKRYNQLETIHTLDLSQVYSFHFQLFYLQKDTSPCTLDNTDALILMKLTQLACSNKCANWRQFVSTWKWNFHLCFCPCCLGFI